MPESVLIIDDDPAIGAALTVRLRAAGFHVTAAGGGLAGLAAAADVRPRVILLDIKMPDIDGFEVNRRLKADAELASTPVVFLSANVQDAARHAALTAGAFAYLSKPYDAKEVVATLRAAIAQAEALAEETSP